MTEQSETPFRIYQVDWYPAGSQAQYECLASTDDVSLGEALLDLLKKGKRVDGIQYRPVDGGPGQWLINPFARRA